MPVSHQKTSTVFSKHIEYTNNEEKDSIHVEICHQLQVLFQEKNTEFSTKRKKVKAFQNKCKIKILERLKARGMEGTFIWGLRSIK